MKEREMTDDIVGLLARHEEAIVSLYKAFSQALPGMSSMWKTMAVEQIADADVLRVLSLDLNAGAIFPKEGHFDTTVLKACITRVEKETLNCITWGVTPFSALSIALDIELSILEKQFFSSLQTHLPRIEKDLAELRNHTRSHAQQLAHRLRLLQEDSTIILFNS